MMGIRLIFTVLPAVFAFVAGLAFIYYPLRDHQLIGIETELIDRRISSGVRA